MNCKQKPRIHSRWIWLWPLLFIMGCAALSRQALDEKFGKEDPSRLDQPAMVSLSAPDFPHDVKPILDSRCVVCHACYDAPCQLKLGAYEGVTRGASDLKIYDTVRLFPAKPTRLSMDAHSNADWRRKGFYPVLNERSPTSEANRDGSVLYRMLALKRGHDWPVTGVLPRERFDFRTDRDQQCPSIEKFDRFQEKHPDWGMPYGLPPLKTREHETLVKWLEAGAPNHPHEPLNTAFENRIAEWEALLNEGSPKRQLASRYIYEHWFLAHLYFDDMPLGTFFELVRSATPPGQPIQVIATRLPYDDPGVPKVYYRLRPIQETVVAKTHMPYALNRRRMARIRELFVDAHFVVTAVPSYQPEEAANPFKTFQELPVESRYRFMLDEAQFTIMTFIKGPVCRGQVAVDVIQDHFWMLFANPDLNEVNGKVFASMLKNLRLPNEADTFLTPLSSWIQYSEAQAHYLKAKSDYLNRNLTGRNAPTLDNIWAGDGNNANAALTVFRHFDSATVVKGLVGEHPQSILIVGYPVLERIYYLLVAGFDVFGNIAHGIHSRLYMDFLRMEAELNALGLLPKASRDAVRDHWYRGASPEVKAYLNGSKAHFDQETGIHYQTQQPYEELLGLLRSRLAPVLKRQFDLERSGLPAFALDHLRRLSQLRGGGLHLLPEMTIMTLHEAKGKSHYFTLLRNSGHSNVAELFNEADRRLPDEDTLTVVNGFIGAYPNAFYDLTTDQLPAFLTAVTELRTTADYARLMDRYGIHRTNPKLWAQSDAIHAAYKRTAPIEAGLLDLNRYENR